MGRRFDMLVHTSDKDLDWTKEWCELRRSTSLVDHDDESALAGWSSFGHIAGGYDAGGSSLIRDGSEDNIDTFRSRLLRLHGLALVRDRHVRHGLLVRPDVASQRGQVPARDPPSWRVAGRDRVAGGVPGTQAVQRGFPQATAREHVAVQRMGGRSGMHCSDQRARSSYLGLSE